MSDEEQIQAPAVDTPVQQDDQQSQVDWEKRYNDLQPEFTRTSQEAAQYRQLVEALQDPDPDTRNEAARLLGFEFASPDEPDEEPFYQDPTDHLASRLEQLETQLQQRDAQVQQEAQLAQAEAHIAREFASIEGLDDSDHAWLVSRAVSGDIPPTQQGMPDIQAAYKELQAWEQGRMKKWASTKNAPRFSAGGQQATSAPNLDNRAERQAWMAERLENAQQQ